MRNLYPRLAATNLKKNRRFYLPYLLACIVIVALFCIMLTLASDPYLGQMQHGGSVSQVLGFGVFIMALFSAIILFYTNSTFTKQRKREFAIYNILGMEKRHISYVLFWESLYTAAMALFFGLVAAGVFSKLLQLVLMRLIGGEATFGLNIRLMSIGYTVVFFGALFLLLLLNTIRIIHLSNPVQLLRAGSEGEREPRSKWILALLGAVSIFFVALLYLFRTQILTVMFGHIEPDVMAATNTYYLYVMASIPGIALYNGGAALFRTMGHSDVSLKVSLLMNSINVIGNAVLIFGFGMDVAGVAIPTLVSRTVAAVVILSLLFNRDLMLHLSDIRGFHLNMRLMKNIFYIGVPSGVENGMFQLGRLVLFSLISTFGTASMVANAIGNTISNFNCFAGQAINLGLAAVVSQCVGAGEFDQARAYLRKIVKWTYGIMAAVNLTIIALLPLIMRVYNVSPEAEKLAVTVTLIHGISSIFIWIPAFMVPGFLRAAGDAKFTMLASMLTMWVVRVLLAYVLGKYMGYGVIGVWFAHAIVDWSVRGAIFFLRYRSGKWETMGIKT